VFQDENRFSTGRIARLNLKRAEKARLIISKIPGTFRTRSNAIRKEYYLVIPIASLNEVRLNQFVVGKSAAVVDNLISRTLAWESERKKPFLYDGVCYFSSSCCADMIRWSCS